MPAQPGCIPQNVAKLQIAKAIDAGLDEEDKLEAEQQQIRKSGFKEGTKYPVGCQERQGEAQAALELGKEGKVQQHEQPEQRHLHADLAPRGIQGGEQGQDQDQQAQPKVLRAQR